VFYISHFYCCIGVHCDIYKSSYNLSHFHHSPLSLPAPLLEQFQQFSFFYFRICICNISTIFNPPTPFLYIFPPSTGTNSQIGPALPTCSPFWKNKFFSFKLANRESQCDISMPTGSITQIGSSPLFFFFLPWSPSYDDFNRFKLTTDL
jgi:hypothetical protein